MEPKNRQKTLFIVVIAIGVLYVADLVIVNPLLAAWNKGEDQVTALKKNYDEGNQMLKSRKTILAKWEKWKAAATPKDMTSEENKVLAAFDKWERASGIKPDRTQHQWRQGDEFTTFEFNADLTGTMTQIERFLYNVENDLQDLALKVEAVKITSRDTDTQRSTPTLTLALQLSGLVLGQPNPNQQ
jgi:hypothetical protein